MKQFREYSPKTRETSFPKPKKKKKAKKRKAEAFLEADKILPENEVVKSNLILFECILLKVCLLRRRNKLSTCCWRWRSWEYHNDVYSWHVCNWEEHFKERGDNLKELRKYQDMLKNHELGTWTFSETDLNKIHRKIKHHEKMAKECTTRGKRTISSRKSKRRCRAREKSTVSIQSPPGRPPVEQVFRIGGFH